MKKLLSVLAVLIFALSIGMQLVQATTQPETSPNQTNEDAQQFELVGEKPGEASKEEPKQSASKEQAAKEDDTKQSKAGEDSINPIIPDEPNEPEPPGSDLDKKYAWTEVTQNPVGEVLQEDGNILVYGFDGTVMEGADIRSGVQFGSPNVYLKTSTGNLIQHIYNADSSSDNSTGSRMFTSKGILMMQESGKGFAEVAKLDNTATSSTYDLKVMTATDEFNHKVIRAQMSTMIDNTMWYIDVTLQPTADAQNIKHEMYFTQYDGTRTIGIGKAVDTRLGKIDTVPIQTIGENRGLYIKQGDYRLNYRFNVADGPQNWTGGTRLTNGKSFETGTILDGSKYNGVGGTAKGGNVFQAQFTPYDVDNLTWTGSGIEPENYPADHIVASKTDTEFQFKWLPKTIVAGETVHYRYDVGIAATGKPIPAVEKKVENVSSPGATEAKVGDKLRYTIDLANSGDEPWSTPTVTDVLPEGVGEIEKIIRTQPNGTSTELPKAGNYDESTRTLSVGMDTFPANTGKGKLSFEVTVKSSDNEQIVNTATGKGLGPDGREYSASGSATMKIKDMPIPEVTKTVKNVSGSSAYLIGDTVEYSLKVKNANTKTKNIWPNVQLKDVVPADLEVDTASFHKTYTKSDGTKEETDLTKEAVWTESTNALNLTQAELRGMEELVVTFKAKIKDSGANKTIQNTLEVISDDFDPLKATADITVGGTLEFISAPANIDFGEHQIKSSKETYKPESWDKQLTIRDYRSLTQAPKWSLTAKMEKPITGRDYATSELDLYYKSGDREDLITEGASTLIRNHTTVDSNEVIVSDDWNDTTGLRLEVPAGKAKNDSYSGTVVWTLHDVPQIP